MKTSTVIFVGGAVAAGAWIWSRRSGEEPSIVAAPVATEPDGTAIGLSIGWARPEVEISPVRAVFEHVALHRRRGHPRHRADRGVVVAGLEIDLATRGELESGRRVVPTAIAHDHDAVEACESRRFDRRRQEAPGRARRRKSVVLEEGGSIPERKNPFRWKAGEEGACAVEAGGTARPTR